MAKQYRFLVEAERCKELELGNVLLAWTFPFGPRVLPYLLSKERRSQNAHCQGQSWALGHSFSESDLGRVRNAASPSQDCPSEASHPSKEGLAGAVSQYLAALRGGPAESPSTSDLRWVRT